MYLRTSDSVGIVCVIFVLVIAGASTSLQSFAQTTINPQITVTTDQSSYNSGDTIVIKGLVTNPTYNTQVTLRVLNPLENLVSIDQIHLSSDGNFSFSFMATGPLWQQAGDFKIIAQYGKYVNSTATFSYYGGYNPGTKFTYPPPITTAPSENTITKQYSKEGIGLGPPSGLVERSPVGLYITTSDDGMPVMNTNMYSLEFPLGWKYNFGVFGDNIHPYEVAFFENPNKTNSSSITLSHKNGFVFGENPIATMMFYLGPNLESWYNYYDNLRNPKTTSATVGSTFVNSYWYSNAYGCSQSAPKSDHNYGCLGVKVHTIRFDSVNDFPAFQYDYSYKFKNADQTISEYRVLDTVYILNEGLMRLSSQAPEYEYDKLYPYFVKSSTSLSLNLSFHARGALENRVMSDFDTFEIDSKGIIDNFEKIYPDMKIEHHFPINVNKIVPTLPPQTPENTTMINIPSWIKDNAKWWSQGQVGDSEFTQGIQYLIEQGIMKIPQTSTFSNSANEIPTWVKNNAKWWSEGSLDDSEFVKGIQYLVQSGIIHINPSKQDTSQTNQQTSSQVQQVNPASNPSGATAIISTNFGEIKFRLLDNVAPKTVGNFEKLSNSGFYDGTIFHRIMPGFVIQGGDPNTIKGDRSTWGLGSAANTIPPEFSTSMNFTKGMVGMARGSDVNSGSSQFFITLGDAPWLNGQYTLFGQVISGQDVADKIAALSTTPDNNQPVDADAARINKITIEK